MNKDEEFISLTQSFLNEDNAIAYIKENNLKFLDEWENVETHVRYVKDGHSKFYTSAYYDDVRKGIYRVELIYRKRQTELNV